MAPRSQHTKGVCVCVCVCVQVEGQMCCGSHPQLQGQMCCGSHHLRCKLKVKCAAGLIPMLKIKCAALSIRRRVQRSKLFTHTHTNKQKKFKMNNLFFTPHQNSIESITGLLKLSMISLFKLLLPLKFPCHFPLSKQMS